VLLHSTPIETLDELYTRFKVFAASRPVDDLYTREELQQMQLEREQYVPSQVDDEVGLIASRGLRCLASPSHLLYALLPACAMLNWRRTSPASLGGKGQRTSDGKTSLHLESSCTSVHWYVRACQYLKTCSCADDVP